jgi:hypothetical protein
MKQQMLEAEVKELKARIEALTAEFDSRSSKGVMPDDTYLMSCLRTIDMCTPLEIERICADAANRIEALTADRDALKARNEYQEKMIRQADVRGDYWRARAEKAEAELETAKEAYDDIEQYARRHCAEVEALTAERDKYKEIAGIADTVARECRGHEARADAAEADKARLREALTFYADAENYKGYTYTDPCGCCSSW